MDEFEVFERQLLDALQQGDHAAVAGMLRPEFLITTAGWIAEPVGRQAWLEGLAEQDLASYDLRLVATRTYGHVAVVLAESPQEGTRAGVPWSLRFRYTDVWVRDGGGWRLAARHASAVA